MQLSRPSKTGQPSRESVRVLIHEACGSVEAGKLPGVPPHAVGSAPRRKLAGLQGVGWEGDTQVIFSGSGGGRGIFFIAPSSPAVTDCVWECWPEAPFAKVPPGEWSRIALREPPCQGVSEATDRATVEAYSQGSHSQLQNPLSSR